MECTRILLLIVFYSFHALCTAQETGDVRLFGGNGASAGIVQIYDNSSWTSVCGHTFTAKAALVACRQLGFDRGYVLPLGAYGEYNDMVPYAGQFQQCATGQETRLLDCTFDDVSKCTPHRLAYASITCMSGEKVPDPAVTVKLDNDRPIPERGYFSTISVYGREMWGRICGQFWDDNDARVVCRKLGYTDGVATYSMADHSLPYLTTEINCLGTEADLSSCPQTDSLCYDDRSAAVVCYQTVNQGPSFSLVGGKAHYGKVVISIDDKSGLICNTSNHDNSAEPWTYKEATVVCRQLNFTGGYVLEEQYDTGAITSVFLDGVTCPTGEEESLLQCQHGGWGEVSAQCTSPDMGVAVYCYSEVRLAGSQLQETEQLHIGRVEIYDTKTWYGVCASAFTQEVAMVTCRQFGLSVAEIMLPGSFGYSYTTSNSISNITCTGTEDKIADCTYSLGQCGANSFHAALLCQHSSTPDSYSFVLSDSYYGTILAERHGVRGYVCREDWDDVDARVMCKKAGYPYGVVLNKYWSFRGKPVWVSKFSCKGTEGSLEDCGYEPDMSSDWACANDQVVAGVLCFLNEPQTTLVRLRDGKSPDHGRAEVYNDVTGWSTICNSGWGNNDAAVFCRQAGFADGQNHVAAFKTNAEADVKVVLSSVKCDGTETSIFECGSNGWLSTSSSCESHTRDAGVYCYKHVKTSSETYGAVQYHTGDEYGLVCADGFSINEATVVCKQKEYNFGLPVCCSGFGPFKNMEFSMSNVTCSGTESSLRDCSFTDDNPVCSSGQYAGVVCTHYNPGYDGIKASPEVEIKYYAHTGLVCSEEFTDADAAVVCRENGLSYGKAFKASGKGLENRIRWLRGLGCSGSDVSFTQCGAPKWGQIGVCSWDSVAAALCSNEAGDMDFDLRLMNGSSVSGRVEIKVKSTWGTVCGNDFTRNEATVICRHLKYHAGSNMPAGHFGPGTGEIILSGMECTGNETSVTECIWSGYGDTSKRCDHTQDAGVTCFYNTRLMGSTTSNYGRLEMHDRSTNKWLAVCDRNLNVNNGNIICRQMGYVAGMFQQGSPLGPTSTDISIVSIDCSDTSECKFETGSCWSDKYIALYCSGNTIVNEDVAIRLPLSSFYGPVSISRFGLWGSICSKGFDDTDALVVCSQLGYPSGTAVRTYATSGYPVIQGSVDCVGTETTIEDCKRGLFAQDPGCYATDTMAGVVCYNDPGLSFGSSELDHETGRMSTRVEIKVNSGLFVSQVKFTDEDAAVYCYTLDYAGGETYHAGSGNYGVTEMSCDGTEESILQCPAVWDPEKTREKTGDLAGVTCYTAVRLQKGDPKYYGVVFTSKGVNNGPVCAEGFDAVDAGVACAGLGFDAGLVLCCAPFGNIDQKPVFTNMQCTGSEKQFTDCVHEDAGVTSCSKDYAAVACYSGSKPTDYTLRFPSSDTSTYAGNLVLAYMGINGSICMDGWDDQDAHVACRELGYQTGVAYTAAKSVTGPYWTSNVNCLGTEDKLSECQFTSFGEVTQCSSTLSHAGVICYDNEGIYSRLYGSGEARYGRLELAIDGEWRSVCNTHWDNEDAHVLCKMLDFRTGEAFQDTYSDTLQGPVWDINFMCDGSEATLTRCLSSGWKSATSEACARHTNDAGAFCYTSVKLSTGVGRRTDQGAVLLYKDDMWYSVCADGFTDLSAKAVCKELGFKDGQSDCCSSTGNVQSYPRLTTHKVICNGNETDVTECLVEGDCTSTDYASVVCYGFIISTTESTTKPIDTPGFDSLPIIIAVVVFLCLLVICAIIVYVILRKRRDRKRKVGRETFDSSIITKGADGSVHVENRLHGITGTPAGTPEVPRVAYGHHGGDHFASISPSYRNPGYGTPLNVDRSAVPVLESERQGQNRTVLNITTSQPYEVPVSKPSTPVEEPHIYDSIRTSRLQASSKEGNDYVDIIQDDGDKDKLTLGLANQDEVSSPTEEKTEPHFLQVADVNPSE